MAWTLSLPSAIGRVLESIQNEELPQLRTDFPGITWSFHGSQGALRESTQALWGGFAIALLAIFALLAEALNGYCQSVIVMAAIPCGIIGAVSLIKMGSLLTYKRR